MVPQYVICVYESKPGRETHLKEKLVEHFAILSKEGLTTSAFHVVMKSPQDNHYIEIFEWKDEEASRQAHSMPSVTRIWDEIGTCADMSTMADLHEAGRQFPHFERVNV